MVLKLLDLYKKMNLNLVGMVILACDVSSWEVKEGGGGVPGGHPLAV